MLSNFSKQVQNNSSKQTQNSSSKQVQQNNTQHRQPKKNRLQGGLELMLRACDQISDALYALFEQHGSWSPTRPAEVDRVLLDIDDLAKTIETELESVPTGPARDRVTTLLRFKKRMDERLKYDRNAQGETEGPLDIVGSLMFVETLGNLTDRTLALMESQSGGKK
jgi:hypothetical protein